MGCCYSCKEDGSSQNGEANERTHLLVDPVSNNTNIQQVNSDDFLNRHPNSLPKKTDEQSALTRILQETANNVIDVAALDSHNLQQHEYVEKMKQYSQRVQQACNQSKLVLKNNSCLLQDISMPDKVLNSEPISVEDRQLITNAVSKAATAVSELKVEHKEDLVVPFRIPNVTM